MDMSKAALPPIQPVITKADKEHPLFPIYQRYRSGMNVLMVEADSFLDWLRSYERDLRDHEIAKHPRFREWQKWMQDNKAGARKCPAGSFPHNFNFWLEGGMW